ncbi:MAG: transposase [Kiritimatiellae bacterium]|nr:transposase [Kiritimatiellia bacterium]
MARPLRIEYPGALYHITSRGNERGRIFSDERDRWHFLDVLSEKLEYYEVTLYAYVLMQNHWHLVARTAHANLSCFVHDVNGAYCTWYNLRHNRAGHLLQGRYRAIVMEEEGYLLSVSAYVHLNPARIKSMKARPVAERAEALADYAWSSYWDYTRALRRKRIPPIHCDVVWGELGVRTARAGRKAYREYIRGWLEKEGGNPLKELKRQSYLGGEEFGEMIEGLLFRDKEISSEILAHDAWRQRPSVPTVAAAAAAHLGLDAEALRQRARDTRGGRDLTMYVCRELAGAPLRVIGEHFGVKPAAVSLALKRVRQTLRSTRRFQRRAERVKAALIKILKT